MRHLALAALLLPLAACESGDDARLEAPDIVVPTDDLTEAPAEDRTDAPAAPINVNTASTAELATVPGAGERMVHEFEEYRPYTSVAQFRREIGKYVDEETVAGYEQYLFVPVDPNASDAATLAQLPGVGPDEATALEAGRPYASMTAFLDRYEETVPSADRERAALYLAE